MASPLFIHICKLMQAINDTRGTDEKKKMVTKFLHGWRQECGGNFFAAMRLLLPQLDRTTYGIKEAKIGKAYVEALGLGTHSEDAYNLMKWKLPSASGKAKTSGDFASIAFDVIDRRSTVATPTQTVQDVNDLLDTLNRSESDEKKKADIFKYVVNNYTAFEQRWLIRIILKDLKMGMSENSIFDVYHPQARELYSVCSNLKRVCVDLENPAVKLGKAVISLFRPFKPQLGYKGQPKDLDHVKQNGVFYIEEKIDGERMQMHYELDSQKFKWFSRKATDYTDLYGSSSMEEGKLSYEITECLKEPGKIKSVILDGEMVAYDPKLDVFLPFGTLKTSAKDESLDPDKAHPCLIIFDIVYYNGNHLVDYPLSDRRKLLASIIAEKRGYLNVLNYKEKSSEQDIVNEMGIVVEQRQEGIMLKHPGSRYECGERGRTWIKIKPEYFDSLGENCDLIVIGGKYGSGRRGNQIAQFMCALRDDRKSTVDDPFFVSFSMIGTGFSFDQIKEFGKFFKDIQRYNPKKLPSWLAHPEKSTEVPDVLVKDFRNAVVIEVKASEVVFSQMWGAGCTLRFPRFVRFRHDKSWKETMTYSEIMQVRRSAGQKQKTYSQQDFTIDPNKKQRSTARRTFKTSLGLVSTQQGVRPENISQVSDVFNGINFYVIIGTNTTITKAKLEYMIKENGGKFLQSDDKANYIIAGRHNIRVDSIIHKKACDIIQPQWIFDCIDAKQLLPLSPKYMLFATDKTKEDFSIMMDKYGDSYMEDATDNSLHEIWDDIPGDIRKVDMDDIRQRYFSNDGFPGMFFYDVTVYFYNKEQLEQQQQICSDESGSTLKTLTVKWAQRQHQLDNFQTMALLIRFYGGHVAQDKHDSTITHVVVQEDQTETDIATVARQFESNRPPYFVTSKWIEQCAENQTLLDETRYDVKIPSVYQ